MTKKKGKELRILSELVEESEVKYTQIILYLAENNLLDQYYDELAIKNKMLIEPSITLEEFNNIILGKTTKNNSKKESKKDKVVETEKN